MKKYNYQEIQDMTTEERRTFIESVPEQDKDVYYDSNDRVIMGSNVGRGLVTYKYIPAKFVDNNKPIYLGWETCYDGKGLKTVKGKARDKIRSYKEVVEIFK